MAKLTESQCAKTANVFAEILLTKGVDDKQIGSFRRALMAALGDIEPKPNLIGCWNGPSTLVTNALKKAKIEPSVLTEVIIITYERNEKLTVYLNGQWTERA